MKHLKMLALAAMAVTAVVAFVGAGTASASVVFKINPDGTLTTLPIGTVIDASQTASAKLSSTGGATLDTCTGATIKTKLTSNSTPGAKGTNEALTWSGCTEPTETSLLGEMEISPIGSGPNGTVTAKKTVVKVNTTIFGAVCEYTAGESLDLGTLVGATSPSGSSSIEINTVVPAKNSFFCPDAKWEANFKITEPSPLTIRS